MKMNRAQQREAAEAAAFIKALDAQETEADRHAFAERQAEVLASFTPSMRALLESE